MNDFTCDLNCPDGKSAGFCCRGCHIQRKSYVNDTNRDKWDDESGFRSPVGCRLERDQMPPDCRSYDCKKDGYDVWKLVWMIRRFDGTGWANSVPLVEHGFGHIKTSVALNDYT